MRQSSEQYKDEMYFPFRNQWKIGMSIGLIREQFQATASLDPLNNVSPLSPIRDRAIFEDTNITSNVATFEKDLVRADGGSIFTDEQYTNTDIGFYGLISDSLSDINGNIDFLFTVTSNSGEKGLKGLSLYFNETYPTEFSIETRNKGVKIFEKNYTNEQMVFKTNDDFGSDADEMIIHITKMNKPYVRFRLRYILLGIGVYFDNAQFLSEGSLDTFTHSRSIELPTQELTLSLENYTDKYDFDKNDSLIGLAEIGQDVTFQIKYVRDDGVVEPVYSTDLELNSFDIDNEKLNIRAVDFLRNENAPIVIDDPMLFAPETTLYDVVQMVIERVGNVSFNVVVDDALKDVPMSFSHIETNVKQALMMIASAGRCVMDLKDKTLTIRRVELSNAELVATSDNALPFSDMRLFDQDDIIRFATFEQNRTRANGISVFPSDTVNADYKTGYSSVSLSDKDGVFMNAPKITLNSSETISPTSLLVNMEDCKATKMTLNTYYNDEPRETLVYDNLDTSIVEILHDFVSFNRMDITINSIAEPNRRAYISYISFDKKIYDMRKEYCIGSMPKGDLSEPIRNIIVKYHNSSVDQEGNIIDEVNDTITSCNIKGVDIEYDNPFITSVEVAMEVGEWLRTYYTTRIEYEFEFVGDPTLEVGDTIKMHNNYNDNVLCDIEDNGIIFSNGGIRGKIRARRREDELARTQNLLAI